ncbi:hypothetical protein AMATHDRAFT_142322 [Amanita thiersii Skay4041]|uniref:Phosphomevalonate kinase n=1 Tax=Amanita thiersii Skay4041 TaxID=703135 RepID=A0A2A9NUZ8_9AGAR|nr:hypothetical protein AMATHDRAFT_142322 [Amanita thiersii Skay4041]
MVEYTLVSSPGKTLIAGGYLILDPTYSGTSISTSARFYTCIINNPTLPPNYIRVRSPQFLNAEWEYALSFEPVFSLNPLGEDSPNKFIYFALQHSLALAIETNGVAVIKEALSTGLDIAILGDNDFYSQRTKMAQLNLPRTRESLAQLSPFLKTGTTLKDVHKTGLGSSAALITSFVSALLLHLSVISKSSFSDVSKDGKASSDDGTYLAHNLAQFVHCLAQGKVGSGFDVATAVFGSQIYTRFNPAVLQDLMDSTQPQNLLAVLSPRNKAWDYSVQSFNLPPCTRLMLADVDAGSDTPSLVGRVLKWRKESPQEADPLWRSLDQLNQSLAQTLLHLSRLHKQDSGNYESAVKYISSLQPVQWEANPWQPPAEIPIVSAFYDVHRISQAIRAKMREMGKLAGVPIEPPEQTKLLDSCVAQAGVIGGGVPGAGGYDAIWVLICNPLNCYPDQHPSERIEHLWSNNKELDVSPLLANESNAKGTRIESLEQVPGLKDMIENHSYRD